MWRVEGEKCWRQQRHLGDFAPDGKIPKLNTHTPATGRRRFKITTGRDVLGKYKDNFLVNS